MEVSVVGATGYTGVELVRLLKDHPQVELGYITSRSFAGEEIADIYPQLREEIKKKCKPLDVDKIAASSEVVFTALPHGVSMEVVPKFREKGVKVIDLSGDYRYRELATYEQWYKKHNSPNFLEEGIYGLAEINRDLIKEGALIANPGCYPTTSLLALYPLIKEGLIEPGRIIIDAKSGVSGAGRKPSRGTHFCEVDGNFKAYKVANHRHQSEIEEKLSGWAKKEVQATFTPHLLPLKRGILATIYTELTGDYSSKELISCYQESYEEEKFIRVLENSNPQLKHVAGTNYCDLTVKINHSGQAIILAAIDNLVKGSAGQAVQNLNLLAGWPEETGLKQTGLYL